MSREVRWWREVGGFGWRSSEGYRAAQPHRPLRRPRRNECAHLHVPPFRFIRSVVARARETPSRCEDTREKNATSLVTRREIRRGGEPRLIVNGGESIAPASPTGKEER